MIFFAILALQCGAGGGETPESGGAGPGSAGERLHRPRRSVPDETTQQRSDNSQAADVPACRLVTGKPSGDGTVFYTACLSSSALQTTSGCCPSPCARQGCTSATLAAGTPSHSETFYFCPGFGALKTNDMAGKLVKTVSRETGSGGPRRPVISAVSGLMQSLRNQNCTQHKILFQTNEKIVIASEFERREQPGRALSAGIGNVVENYKCSVQLRPETAQPGGDTQSACSQQLGRSSLPTLPTTQQHTIAMNHKPPQSVDCGHVKPNKALSSFCPTCAELARQQREILLDFGERITNLGVVQPSKEEVARLQIALAQVKVGPDAAPAVKQEQPSLFSSGAGGSLNFPIKQEAPTLYSFPGAASLGGGPCGGRGTSNPPSPSNSMFKFTGIGADGCGGTVVTEKVEEDWNEKFKQEIDVMDEYYERGRVAGAISTVEKVFPSEMQYQYEEGRQAGLNSGYGDGFDDGYARRDTEALEQEQERIERAAVYSDNEYEDENGSTWGDGLPNLAGPDAMESDEFSLDEFSEEDAADEGE